LEPVWVLLPFGAAAIPALLYLRSREEFFPALRFWVLAWFAIWAAGMAVALADRSPLFYVLSNFIGPGFSALLLAGSYRFVERPIPTWLLPVAVGICSLAGFITYASNVLGGIASSVLEAPLVVWAGWLILQGHPTPGLVTRWLGVVYLGLAVLIGFDWIGQTSPETGEAIFIAWIGIGVTSVFTQTLAFAESFRDRAKHLTRERDLLRSLAHVAVGPDGSLETVDAALAKLPRLLNLAGFGVWRIDTSGKLRYVAGHSMGELGLPDEFADANATHPVLAGALLADAPRFVDETHVTMPEAMRRSGYSNGFVAPLRAGGELVGVMGGLFERNARVGPGERRFVSDLCEEVAFVLAHLGIRHAQERAGEQREIESRQLRAMIEAVPAGILLLDQDRRIVLMSPLLADHLLCGAPEAWLGRSVNELRDECLERFPEASRKTLKRSTQPDSRVVDFELKNEKGALLKVTVHPVTDEGGEAIGSVWMVRDITDERQLAERVQFAERMQTVETLAGGLAHDFNNQLTSILGNASFLEEEIGDRNGPRQTLHELARSAEHCAELTRGLLTFTRQDLTEVKPVRLAEVLSQVGLLMRPSMGPEVTFDVELADDLGWVDADAAQLRRIVTNLLANARDAVSGRGRIELRAGRSEDENTFWIEVRDDGAGMSSETQRRIFEPFFTTKETGRGTGLGLAIVYGIVERNGGQIAVDSAPGSGTCFRLTWPAREEPAPGLDAPPTASPTTRGTVLLAEDEPSVRRLVRRTLEAAGYRVEAVADGIEAVEQFRKNPHGFDLALLDLSMPGCTGLEALEDIRVDAPDLPVLIVSGHPDRENVPWPEDVPILPKPFSPRTLVDRVSELLGNT
jgi:PAS domain S-box-containing protein